MAYLIKDALLEDGLTQTRFAQMAGVSLKHLNEVLRGKAGVQPETLDHWAAVLDREWHIELRAPGGS
jgi:transcriptional regulator with XRE-family HTH domain